MQYFTGRFQGRVPILSEDKNDAEIIEDVGPAIDIRILLSCIYGGREWEHENAEGYEGETYNYIIFRP